MFNANIISSDPDRLGPRPRLQSKPGLTEPLPQIPQGSNYSVGPPGTWSPLPPSRST
jgi:hypothetical protein